MIFFSKETDLFRLERLKRLVTDFDEDLNRRKFYLKDNLDCTLVGIFLYAGFKSYIPSDRDGNIGHANFFDPQDLEKEITLNYEDVSKLSKDLSLLEKHFDQWDFIVEEKSADFSKDFEQERQKLDFISQNGGMSDKAINLLRGSLDRFEEKAKGQKEITYKAIHKDGFKITVGYESYLNTDVEGNNSFSKIKIYFLMGIYEIQKHHGVK